MQPERKEWDLNILRTCMFLHDIQEVLKIRLSDKVAEDTLAWHYERSGIFSVRSAYRLALQLNQGAAWEQGSSTNPGGERALWQKIWAADVPQKVKIFAWRQARNALATQENRKARNLTKFSTCQICGNEEEDSHHAVVRCTKAQALRHEMRKVWQLPAESFFQRKEEDWLLNLLNRSSKEEGACTLLLLWRAWHLRNDAIHAKGMASVVGSARFLTSYRESLLSIRQRSQPGLETKGKGKMFPDARPTGRRAPDETAKWEPPPAGWFKANVDASYRHDTGEASAGVVIRDEGGQVALSSWRVLRHCNSPGDAEALALFEGARLAAQWIRQPTIIETDCWELIEELKKDACRHSDRFGLLQDISAACRALPEFKLSKTRRGANRIAHELARWAMQMKELVVTRFNFPQCVRSLVESERVKQPTSSVPHSGSRSFVTNVLGSAP